MVECPNCCKNGLDIELADGIHIVWWGRPFKDFPYEKQCQKCGRTIQFDIEYDKTEIDEEARERLIKGAEPNSLK